MKIVNFNDIESIKIDNEVAKGVAGRVLIGKDDGAENFCMRIFEVAPNGHTPCHTHEWEHEIFIHSGTGEVLCNDEWKKVSQGTALFIPGNESHQFRNMSEELFVFLCIIPSGVQEL